MKQHHQLTVALCLTWVVTLLYGEMLAFWLPSLWSCSWPSPSAATNSSLDVSDDFVKVAVLADPQLMDRTSLRLAPKSLAMQMAQFYTDLYMRRAFFASVLPFKPDVILFLGDHFDGGPYLSDEEWQESLSRFKHIFGLKDLKKYKDIPVYYLSGNHDIGYSALHSQKPEVISRYENEFGMRNHQFTVGKVEFIAVDAQSLDGHPEGKLPSATWTFVKNKSVDVPLRPRVLLTHIPLYRRDWTPCGPHRNSPIINQRLYHAPQSQEILYQNYITEESSNNVLNSIKPVLVISGHDHDQCTVMHETSIGSIKEQTVGTISWQQGNLYPSFMLLSASNSSPLSISVMREAVRTQLCFLPNQTYIYIWYLLQFLLTLLALLLGPTTCMSFLHRCIESVTYIKLLFNCNIFKGGMKEKDEDENCEYEMIWDAEGSMHLVKKPVIKPTARSSDKGTVERGTAVMRTTAKKSISPESEVHTIVDMNADVDPSLKLPLKASKSQTRIVIQKLLQTFYMLTAIAVVNVPLYMMLLFKDWID